MNMEDQDEVGLINTVDQVVVIIPIPRMKDPTTNTVLPMLVAVMVRYEQPSLHLLTVCICCFYLLEMA